MGTLHNKKVAVQANDRNYLFKVIHLDAIAKGSSLAFENSALPIER